MSLTDDWKARKLKAGPYYVRLSNGRVDVAKLSKFNRFYAISYTFEVVEVLAPCDYEELKRVRDENNDLSALVTSNEIEIAHPDFFFMIYWAVISFLTMMKIEL